MSNFKQTYHDPIKRNNTFNKSNIVPNKRNVSLVHTKVKQISEIYYYTGFSAWGVINMFCKVGRQHLVGLITLKKFCLIRENRPKVWNNPFTISSLSKNFVRWEWGMYRFSICKVRPENTLPKPSCCPLKRFRDHQSAGSSVMPIAMQGWMVA